MSETLENETCPQKHWHKHIQMKTIILLIIGYLSLISALFLNLVSAPRYETTLYLCVVLCAIAVVMLLISIAGVGSLWRKIFALVSVCFGIVIALDAMLRLIVGARVFDIFR